MEIFQTIWESLTIPNERLLVIILFFLSFIETAVCMLLFSSIFDIQSKNKQKLIYVLVVPIVGFFIKNFIPSPYYMFLNIVITGILIKYLFQTNILKTVLSILIPYFIMIMYELIFSKVYLLLFNINIEILSLVPIYRMLFVLIGSLFMFLISIFIKKLKFNTDILNNVNKKSKYLLILNFSIGIIILIAQSFLTTHYSDSLPSIYIIFNILSLFTYFIISIYSLSKTTELQKANQDIENLQLYNKTLSILHDNIRAFKHDFNNIVQAIGGYVATEDMNGLKKYYSDLLGDCHDVNNLTTLSPEVINNPSIFGILASKYHKADELGITISLEVFMDLNDLNMKIYEFTRILGILLDNSIEAAKECKEKLINVVIRPDFKVKRQLLIIENTYKEKDVDTDKIFEKAYTTKKGNTGLGLWEVRQILKKNMNLNLFTSKDDKFFKQQLEIYK